MVGIEKFEVTTGSTTYVADMHTKLVIMTMYQCHKIESINRTSSLRSFRVTLLQPLDRTNGEIQSRYILLVIVS